MARNFLCSLREFHLTDFSVLNCHALESQFAGRELSADGTADMTFAHKYSMRVK